MPNSYLHLKLDALRSQSGLSQEVVHQFSEFIVTAPEKALFRANPITYATDRGLDEITGVNLFLHATHVGIFEFTWGLLCPGCRAFLNTPSSLKSLKDSKYCPLCEMDIMGVLDQNVEVAFTVSPTIRSIRFHDLGSLDFRKDGFAIIFSPSLVIQHSFYGALAKLIIDTGSVEPGQTFEKRIALEEGSYSLMDVFNHHGAFFRVESNAPTQLLHVDLLRERMIPNQKALKPDSQTLQFKNRTDGVLHYLLMHNLHAHFKSCPFDAPQEKPQLRAHLDGKTLITSQVFRDLFGAASIPAEGGTELKNLTILFTDLKDSTQMYDRIGDLRAFSLVRQHFDLLRDVVASKGGSLVKTIGDAIMACFAEPVSAVDAAIAMSRDVTEVVGEEKLQLKIGLHSGPCIAVESNDRLDYFGQTVNIAARIQALAAANEITCTDAVLEAPGVSPLIENACLHATRSHVGLKGILQQVPVTRLSPRD